MSEQETQLAINVIKGTGELPPDGEDPVDVAKQLLQDKAPMAKHPNAVIRYYGLKETLKGLAYIFQVTKGEQVQHFNVYL